MLMTVTNLTANQINYLDYYYGYPGVPPVTNAIGGNLVTPVPYPFDWVQPFQPNGVVIAPGGPGNTYEVQLPVHFDDLGYAGPVEPNFGPLKVQTLWNQLIQAGTVSVSFAAEVSTDNDFGDQFVYNVVHFI